MASENLPQGSTRRHLSQPSSSVIVPMAFVLSLLMALVLVSYGPGGSLGCDLSQNHVLVGRQNLRLLGQMRRLSPRFCLQDRKDFAFPQEMVEGGQLQEAQANGITCIYRYAEVLLMYAEASTRANNTVSEKALEQLQEVQKRAQGYPENPTLTETTDPQAFLKAVSDERGWEFFAEMKRWFELVRLEKVSEVKQAQWNGSIFQSFNHYYFPIPHQQIELTGWQNNPGY